jgi:PH (Pleckstrin Homology) domain-containing protein
MQFEIGSTAADGLQAMTRFYYNRFVHRLLRGYAAFGFIGWVCVAIAAAQWPPVLRAAIVVMAFAWLYVAWVWWGRTIGLEVQPEGIRVGLGFGRRYVAWSEIECFRARDAFTPSLRAQLTSGEQLKIPLAQGRKMAWNGGSTTDIVGVMNHELAQASGRDLLRVRYEGGPEHESAPSTQ